MLNIIRASFGLRAIALVATSAFLALPVVAQDDEGVDAFVLPAFSGVAVSQAPEAGLGICFSPLAEDGMSCAQQQCMAESGLGEADCAVNLWCYPAGWVADIFMQHAEGPHWHKVVCDQSDRESLDALVAAECAKDYLIECTAVRIWDADGTLVVGEGAVEQIRPEDVMPVQPE
jgi:hypothetical protein